MALYPNGLPGYSTKGFDPQIVGSPLHPHEDFRDVPSTGSVTAHRVTSSDDSNLPLSPMWSFRKPYLYRFGESKVSLRPAV